MRDALLEYLICPGCGAPLDLHALRSDTGNSTEIEEGLLVCTSCRLPYPVTGGIARLLPNAFSRQRKFRAEFAAALARIDFHEAPRDEIRSFEALHRLTARAFGYEWNTYRVTSPEEDAVTWYWLTGVDAAIYDKLPLCDVFTYYPTAADVAKIDRSVLAGQTVLDIGCGMGKYVAVASETAKTVIGLDLSDALGRARTMLKERRNVHLVQGNILNPPLRAGFADFVYSVGVLHHTPDCHAAFLRSASLTRPGGKLAVWLYPNESDPNPYSDWVHWVQDDVLRPITCRMPPPVLRAFCAVLGRLTFVRDRAVARHRRTGSHLAYLVAKYAGAVAVGQHKDPQLAAFLNFDWYSPQYRSYHSEKELEQWYRQAGFAHVRSLPQRVSAIGTR